VGSASVVEFLTPKSSARLPLGDDRRRLPEQESNNNNDIGDSLNAITDVFFIQKFGGLKERGYLCR